MRSRKGIQAQEGLVSLLCAERRRVFGVGVAGGKGPQRRGPEDGGFLAGCRLGGSLPPFLVVALVLCLWRVLRNKANREHVRFGTPRLIKAEESAENLL